MENKNRLSRNRHKVNQRTRIFQNKNNQGSDSSGELFHPNPVSQAAASCSILTFKDTIPKNTKLTDLENKSKTESKDMQKALNENLHYLSKTEIMDNDHQPGTPTQSHISESSTEGADDNIDLTDETRKITEQSQKITELLLQINDNGPNTLKILCSLQTINKQVSSLEHKLLDSLKIISHQNHNPALHSTPISPIIMRGSKGPATTNKSFSDAACQTESTKTITKETQTNQTTQAPDMASNYLNLPIYRTEIQQEATTSKLPMPDFSRTTSFRPGLNPQEKFPERTAATLKLCPIRGITPLSICKKLKEITCPPEATPIRIVPTENHVELKFSSLQSLERARSTLNASILRGWIEIIDKEPKIAKLLILGVPARTTIDCVDNKLKQIAGPTGLIKYSKKLSNRDNTDNWLIETNILTRRKLLAANRITVGFTTCRIEPFVTIRRCTLCQSLGHTDINCTNELFCERCGDQHSIKNCNETTPMCINCQITNDEEQTAFDTNHLASDPKCPTFLYYKQQAIAKARGQGGQANYSPQNEQENETQRSYITVSEEEYSD